MSNIKPRRKASLMIIRGKLNEGKLPPRTFKELREQFGLSLTQFRIVFGIPYRTLQNWECGARKCPQYLLELMEYKLDNEYKKYIDKAKKPPAPRGYYYDEQGALKINDQEASKMQTAIEAYIGNHTPIISMPLYDKVQDKLKNK